MSSKTSNTKKKERSDPLTFHSPDFDPNEYAKVAQHANLEDIRLESSVYNVKHDCFAKAESSDKELNQGFFGGMSGHTFDAESGILVGGYTWGAEVKFGRKKVLKLKCEYILIYSGLDDSSPDYARLYFQKLARFTSYPYFRSHFAVQTTASGLNIGPLPSLIDRVD